MGASAETLELPLSTRVAMGQLDALYAAQVKATKSLKDYFVVNEDGTTTLKAGLQEHIVMLENVTNSRVKLARQINSEVQLHKEELALLRDKADLINRMAQWQSSQGPDMSGMMGRWRQGQRDALLEANAARGSMTDRMGAWQANQGPDMASKVAAWQAEKGAIEARNLVVQQAIDANSLMHTSQGRLQIMFVTLTKDIEDHKRKIEQLILAERIDEQAIEKETQALGNKQLALQKVERQIAGSNAAFRNARLVTQSASYAIQDFVQGLSVGSFSMAVRGAANNVETLAATMTMGSSAAVAMGASLIPTVALIGVGLYEAFRHTNEETKKATDNSQAYRQELERIRGVGIEITQGEYERAKAVERRSYAEKRAELSKDDIKKTGEANAAREALQVTLGDGWREKLADQREKFEKRRAELRKRGDPISLAAANQMEFGSFAAKNLGWLGLEQQIPALEAAERGEAAARGRLQALDIQENKAQQRITVQSLLAKHRGKLTEIAGKAQARGVAGGAVRAVIRDAIGGFPGVDAATADEATNVFMQEANINAADGKFGAARNRLKDQVEDANRGVALAKANHEGAWAVGQAEKKAQFVKTVAELFGQFTESPIGLMMEMRDILGAIRDGVNDGTPQNNVNRNNANVLEGAARFMGWNL